MILEWNQKELKPIVLMKQQSVVTLRGQGVNDGLFIIVSLLSGWIPLIQLVLVRNVTTEGINLVLFLNEVLWNLVKLYWLFLSV